MSPPGCKPGQGDAENQLLPMQQVPLFTLAIDPKEQQGLIQCGTDSVTGVAGMLLKASADHLGSPAPDCPLGLTPEAFPMTGYAARQQRFEVRVFLPLDELPYQVDKPPSD